MFESTGNRWPCEMVNSASFDEELQKDLSKANH